MIAEKRCRTFPSAIPLQRRRQKTTSENDTTLLDLPFSLYHSFAELAGVPIKFCGIDGQPLSGAPVLPAIGPCAVLNRGDAFADACAKSHAGAAEVAAGLRRPYIFNCHVRLAGWAIPLLLDGEPLPATIICGGVLLIEPDRALLKHMERIASGHDVDPAFFVRSLRSVPVISRSRLRDIADFLFRMSTTFLVYSSVPHVAESSGPSPADSLSHASIVFPSRRRKETEKAKLRRAGVLIRRNIEMEVVRLLRERKTDEALHILVHTLMREVDNAGPRGSGASLCITEALTRLFRSLAGDAQVSPTLYDKYSRLLEEVLAQEGLGGSPDDLRRLSRKFILISEELTGKPRPRQTRTIQRFLESNLSKKLTLGTVGKKFGIKEKALNALILKNCGMSFTDYVTSLRVSEAKHLLLNTESGIGEIARRTGFRDQSYFTKVFKSQLGLTPTEFRSKWE